MKVVNVFTTDCCVDCGKTFDIDVKEWETSGLIVFKKNLAICKIYRDVLHDHFVIVAKTSPEKVFLSCRQLQYLTHPEGIRSIVNFIARADLPDTATKEVLL